MNQIGILWRTISWRGKMMFIAVCYAAIIAFAAVEIIGRYYMALSNPKDFGGGMAAAGDIMLELLICLSLLVPTFLLALAVREREAASISFAKALLGFSLTSLLSLGLALIPAISQTDNIVGTLCMYRLVGSPIGLAGIGTSRLLARYRPAKRLISIALLSEGAALVLCVVSVLYH